MTTSIRAERPADADAIRRINDAAFGKRAEGRIVDRVRRSERWIVGGSLVAESEDDALVGHALMSEGDLDPGAGAGATRRIWLLGPVAVVPERQRQGIGGALVRAAIALATERGQPVLCVLGHAAYYPRFGFQPARPLGIRPPRPWPDESWMALRLPGWSPSLRGVACYPPAFPDSQ